MLNYLLPWFRHRSIAIRKIVDVNDQLNTKNHTNPSWNGFYSGNNFAMIRQLYEDRRGNWSSARPTNLLFHFRFQREEKQREEEEEFSSSIDSPSKMSALNQQTSMFGWERIFFPNKQLEGDGRWSKMNAEERIDWWKCEKDLLLFVFTTIERKTFSFFERSEHLWDD